MVISPSLTIPQPVPGDRAAAPGSLYFGRFLLLLLMLVSWFTFVVRSRFDVGQLLCSMAITALSIPVVTHDRLRKCVLKFWSQSEDSCQRAKNILSTDRTEDLL